MLRVKATRFGEVKHRPLWQKLFFIIIGLLIVFSGLFFAFPRLFLALGIPVQGALTPFWFRLATAFILMSIGLIEVIYGIFS